MFHCVIAVVDIVVAVAVTAAAAAATTMATAMILYYGLMLFIIKVIVNGMKLFNWTHICICEKRKYHREEEEKKH